MNVLIVGNGAREHAIAWKISQSAMLKKLYATPNNPGIAKIATCFDIAVMDFAGILEICQTNAIDLVIVGPEAPLCEGIVDYLSEYDIRVFGPHRLAAQLEGSKTFAKEFMVRHGIPTAKFERFNDASMAKQALGHFSMPIVVKADGLAAGKGVIIAQTLSEAHRAIDDMLINNKFGTAGQIIVLEEFLTGVEASQICFVDQNSIVSFESSQDYKRAYDEDQGFNTGGMGNYSPSRLYNKDICNTIKTTILNPFLKGLQVEGMTYSGWIFIGLMLQGKTAKVIEFNVRFGDPEAECLLPRLQTDLLLLINATLDNRISEVDLKFKSTPAVTVIMASKGYPEQYEKGKIIQGLEEVKDACVFYGGTANKNDQIVTDGGRVLAVTALGKDLKAARTLVYQQVQKIHFEGAFYRKDIAK